MDSDLSLFMIDIRHQNSPIDGAIQAAERGEKRMFLTDEEAVMLDGGKGPAVQKAMQILVALGESFGAERLVPVNNVHMAGSSVLVAEEAGTRFVEDIRNQGGKFITRVTTNPTAVDPTQWADIGIPESDAVLQTRLTAAYATTLAAVPWTWTDTGEINKELPNVKRPALCNRLASLLRDHLVERRDHPSDAKQLQWRRQ